MTWTSEKKHVLADNRQNPSRYGKDKEQVKNSH